MGNISQKTRISVSLPVLPTEDMSGDSGRTELSKTEVEEDLSFSSSGEQLDFSSFGLHRASDTILYLPPTIAARIPMMPSSLVSSRSTSPPNSESGTPPS